MRPNKIGFYLAIAIAIAISIAIAIAIVIAIAIAQRGTCFMSETELIAPNLT